MFELLTSNLIYVESYEGGASKIICTFQMFFQELSAASSLSIYETLISTIFPLNSFTKFTFASVCGNDKVFQWT